MSTTNKSTTGAWLTIALIIVIIFVCIAIGGEDPGAVGAFEPGDDSDVFAYVGGGEESGVGEGEGVVWVVKGSK